MNNYDLLRKYRHYDANAIRYEVELKKQILGFFEKDSEYHFIELLINDSGKWVIITDYAAHGKGHIPLERLYEFCDEFGMTLESISHEVSEIWERNINKKYTEHEEIYTIAFEIINKKIDYE